MHKRSVNCLKWNQNGHHLVTGSKDASLKVTDTAHAQRFRFVSPYNRSSVTWHRTLSAFYLRRCGCRHWIVGAGSDPHAEVRGAHESQTNDIAWHSAVTCLSLLPTTIKFWCRNRPGELRETPPLELPKLNTRKKHHCRAPTSHRDARRWRRGRLGAPTAEPPCLDGVDLHLRERRFGPPSPSAGGWTSTSESADGWSSTSPSAGGRSSRPPPPSPPGGPPPPAVAERLEKHV